MEPVRMRFYRFFNSIYAKTRGANSELVTVELMKSYCLPFILYASVPNVVKTLPKISIA